MQATVRLLLQCTAWTGDTRNRGPHLTSLLASMVRGRVTHQDANEDGCKVDEQVQCVLDVVLLTSVRPLNDQLRQPRRKFVKFAQRDRLDDIRPGISG